jgi:hypothetical protein
VIAGHSEESELSRFAQLGNDASEMSLPPARAADVLAELYKLLEEYGPAWYTEQYHSRAESALRLLNSR